METLDEIIAALVKHEAAADPAAVAAALRKGAQPIYQAVFDKGHATATAARAQAEKTLQDEVARLTGELEAAVAEKGEQPDVQKIRSDYQEQEARLKQELKDTKAAAATTLHNALRERDVKDVQARLVAQGVEPEYAELQAQKAAGRLQYQVTDSGTVLEVYQAGKQIVLQADDPLGALAAEITAAVPPKWKTSTADGGGGFNGGGGGGAGGGNLYDRIRQEAQERQKARAEGAGPPAAARLGLASGTDG